MAVTDFAMDFSAQRDGFCDGFFVADFFLSCVFLWQETDFCVIDFETLVSRSERGQRRKKGRKNIWG